LGDIDMAKIDNKERITNLPESQYKELLGVDKPTFDKMYSIVLTAYAELHKQGGKPPTLTVLDKLVITLGYWREYRTYRNIAFDYGVGKSAIGKSIIWVEDTLIKDGVFSLPSKREMQRKDNIVCVAVVDVTEQEIERPQKNSVNGIPVRKSGTQQKPLCL
jgi:hypothetical protein